MSGLARHTVLVVMLGTAAFPAPAAAGPDGGPCAVVRTGFSLDVVGPRDFQEYFEDVFNCSDMVERLVVVRVKLSACGFRDVVRNVTTLPPRTGVGGVLAFLAPECPGTHRVATAVFLAGTGDALDAEVASFRVVPPPVGPGSASYPAE